MTVEEMVKLIESDMSNWSLVKGTFIDEFNNADMEQKNKLIIEEPEFRLELPYFVMPYIASMVHNFCTDNKIEKPDWIWKSKYFCQRPYFPKGAKGNLKTWLLLYSPPQFKYRNLYVDPDSLTRT